VVNESLWRAGAYPALPLCVTFCLHMLDILQEVAMKKAEEGDFVGDICIVSAFGLPKVLGK